MPNTFNYYRLQNPPEELLAHPEIIENKDMDFVWRFLREKYPEKYKEWQTEQSLELLKLFGHHTDPSLIKKWQDSESIPFKKRFLEKYHVQFESDLEEKKFRFDPDSFLSQ